jgi:hypothetical protein
MPKWVTGQAAGEELKLGFKKKIIIIIELKSLCVGLICFYLG